MRQTDEYWAAYEKWKRIEPIPGPRSEPADDAKRRMNAAADRFFVDTNVLLYSVDYSDATKHARAREWLDRLWTTGFRASELASPQ